MLSNKDASQYRTTDRRDKSRESAMSSLKVIGILGCNFCGSTALSAILDCLPHVLSVGETHRLIDRAWGCKKCTYILCEKCKACPGCTDTRPCKECRDCLDCQFIPCSSHGGCRECGDAPCPIFTAELLEQLRQCPKTGDPWWKTISDHTGSEVIVSSDKRPRHYDRLGHPDYLLMTIKNVREHVFSYARRPKTRAGEPEVFNQEDISKAINKLVKDYRAMFKWIRELSLPLKIVSIEEVLDQPAFQIRQVCDWAGVPFVDVSFDYHAVPHHYIAGNFSVRRGKKNRVKHANSRWQTRLTDQMQKMIVEDRRILSIADQLGNLQPDAAGSFLPTEKPPVSPSP